MRTPTFFPALLALLTPLSSPAQDAAAEPEAAALLKPEFFPGKIYNYVTDTSVAMQLPARPGQAAPAARRVSMELHARLEATPRKDAAGVSIQASTSHLKMEISSGEKKVAYDSKDSAVANTKEAKVLARHFEGATMRTLALDLDENGKVVKAVEQGGGGPATPLPGLPQFGPDELKQLVAGMIQGFPPDPVKAGDEWVQKGTRSLGQFGEIDFEITYRYAGDEDFEGTRCARIEYSGALKGDVAVRGTAPGAAGGKIAFEGTELTGLLIFDKVRKAVRLSEQKVKMNIEAPSAGSKSGTIRLPMLQSVTSRLVSVQDA